MEYHGNSQLSDIRTLILTTGSWKFLDQDDGIMKNYESKSRDYGFSWSFAFGLWDHLKIFDHDLDHGPCWPWSMFLKLSYLKSRKGLPAFRTRFVNLRWSQGECVRTWLKFLPKVGEHGCDFQNYIMYTFFTVSWNTSELEHQSVGK